MWTEILIAVGTFIGTLILTNWKRIFNLNADAKVNKSEISNMKSDIKNLDKGIKEIKKDGKESQKIQVENIKDSMLMLMKVAIGDFRNEFQKIMFEYAKTDDIKEINKKLNDLEKEITAIHATAKMTTIFSKKLNTRMGDLEDGNTPK
jgi:hypothetical protein